VLPRSYDGHVLLFLQSLDAGVTTISAEGTYAELIHNNAAFRSWHEYKWGSHNSNVGGAGAAAAASALALHVDATAAAVAAAATTAGGGGGGNKGDTDEGDDTPTGHGRGTATALVDTSPSRHEELLRQQLRKGVRLSVPREGFAERSATHCSSAWWCWRRWQR
jgi:hypothetical protein